MESTSTLVNATRQHDTFTANGAVTHSTSLDAVVDMFFIAGASRNMHPSDIIAMFERAYIQNPDLAVKCLFWARDCRGGAGERRFFQILMKHIIKFYPSISDQLMVQVPKFGYWKDVFQIEAPNANNIDWISRQLTEQSDRLLAKWYPRKGTWFNALHKKLKVTPKEARKLLVTLSDGVVEKLMCAKQWGNIKYSSVPSRAFNAYKQAFERQDMNRFNTFVESVSEGTEKVNAGQLFPYELFQSYKLGERTDVINAQWKALPNYVTEGSFLPVCDVSGSMYGLPMDISVSLGVYLSERNKSIFKDAFITFSGIPKMQYLTGDTCQRFGQLETADWGGNTNLQAVFELILASAKRGNVAPGDMPETLLIISDMEFDYCATDTNLEAVEKQYQASGYAMPKIAFWNVNGRKGNVPASAKKKDVALISGASPSIVKSVLSGKDFSPVGIMLETLGNERYKDIMALC